MLILESSDTHTSTYDTKTSVTATPRGQIENQGQIEAAACFSVFTENKHGGLQSHHNAVKNMEKSGRLRLITARQPACSGHGTMGAAMTPWNVHVSEAHRAQRDRKRALPWDWERKAVPEPEQEEGLQRPLSPACPH